MYRSPQSFGGRVTPEERLKEIEETNKMGMYSDSQAADIDWLINRVKRLTQALESIQYWKCDASVCCFPVDIEKILKSDD